DGGVGALEDVVDERGAAAVGELVGVAFGGQAVHGPELVGAEHVLAAFLEGFAVGVAWVLVLQGVELVEVFDVVGEVGDGAVVEVAAGLGVGEFGGGVADERADRRRPAGVALLVHEPHGHGG